MEKQFKLLRNIRATYLKELDQLSLEQLNYIPNTHNNNIIWNIGHCVVIQELLCYALSGLECNIEKGILGKYRKGSTPDGKATQEEVDFIRRMLVESVDLLEKDYQAGRFTSYKPYTVGFGAHLTSVEEAMEFNLVHEGLHYGYLLALKKLV